MKTASFEAGAWRQTVALVIGMLAAAPYCAAALFQRTWNTYSRMITGMGMPRNHSSTGRIVTSGIVSCI